MKLVSLFACVATMGLLHSAHFETSMEVLSAEVEGNPAKVIKVKVEKIGDEDQDSQVICAPELLYVEGQNGELPEAILASEDGADMASVKLVKFEDGRFGVVVVVKENNEVVYEGNTIDNSI